MKRIRKIPTEREMIEQLQMGRVSLPPLSFRLLKGRPQAEGNLRFDALVEASWGEIIAKFAVECKSLSTPKAFQDGLNLLKTSSLPKGCRPLLFVPFLSERQLQELEREKISGIDLCGNGVVVVPEMFAIFRSGEKNRFTSSAPIKNIYRKNSSMVGRVFLLRSGYDTVQDVCAEINQRNLLVKRLDKKAKKNWCQSLNWYEVARPLFINLKGGYHISCPYGYVGRGRVRVVTHGLNLPRHGTEMARRICGFYPVRGAGQNRRP